MQLGIILQTDKPEHVWNTFRFANTALKAGHSVRVILMNEGVEIEDISDTAQFDISKKIEEFKNLKGTILACASCLTVRSKGKSAICPTGTMSDLVRMVEDSDKVLVFG